MKVTVLWSVTPCRLVYRYQRFRGICCLHLQGRRVCNALSSYTASYTKRQSSPGCVYRSDFEPCSAPSARSRSRSEVRPFSRNNARTRQCRLQVAKCASGRKMFRACVLGKMSPHFYTQCSFPLKKCSLWDGRTKGRRVTVLYWRWRQWVPLKRRHLTTVCASSENITSRKSVFSSVSPSACHFECRSWRQMCFSLRRLSHFLCQFFVWWRIPEKKNGSSLHVKLKVILDPYGLKLNSFYSFLCEAPKCQI
jgi:hypothetical protein